MIDFGKVNTDLTDLFKQVKTMESDAIKQTETLRQNGHDVSQIDKLLNELKTNKTEISENIKKMFND